MQLTRLPILHENGCHAYIGEWIAICGQKIVSHGKNVKKVFEEAKKSVPQKDPH